MELPIQPRDSFRAAQSEAVEGMLLPQAELGPNQGAGSTADLGTDNWTGRVLENLPQTAMAKLNVVASTAPTC